MTVDLHKHPELDVVTDVIGELIVRRDADVAPRPAAEAVTPEPLPPKPVPRARVAMVGTLILGRPVHVITTLAARPGVRAIAKHTARHTAFPFLGVKSWSDRAWQQATFAAHHRVVEAFERLGDQPAKALALKALEDAKDKRSQRLRELPGLVYGLLRLAAVLGLVGAGAIVAGGVLVWAFPGGWGWNDWWGAVFGVAGFLGTVVFLLLTAVVYGWLPMLTLAAWNEGRRRTTVSWMQTSRDDTDVVIDERTVTLALAALRIPEIRDYLKTGNALQYLVPCRQDGRGTYCQIRLPVPAEEIAKPTRRARLAVGTHRATKEVWPTVGAEAGIMDLWIADKGALAEGAGEYPLLDEGFTDIWKGFPFGKTLRGAPLMAPMMERNTIVGGMPGQGKSSAARVLMAGAALDIIVELRIWVPDTNFDFEAFRPRCSRYVMGAEDEKIEQIRDDLAELHREVQTRGELLVRYEIPSVTPEYARRDVGLHPIVVLLEEAHIAFTHPEYGAEIAQLFVDIVRLGRKRGIHMIPSTQAPTKDSMPRDVTRNCTNGLAFAVGDHVANDGLLGQGAYRAGHRATELIPGDDKGVCVAKGFGGGERSQLVQAYFLDIEKGHDQITPIIDRALDAIARAGKDVPGTGVSRSQLEAERDLLEDLDTVLGVEALPSADVPALLAAHAPSWAPYRKLNGKSLRARLATLGIKVPSTGNRWPLDPVVVREALAARATADLDDDGGGE